MSDSLSTLEVLEITKLELEKTKLSKELSDLSSKILIEELSRKVNILELNARKRSLHDQKHAANLRHAKYVKGLCEKHNVQGDSIGWDPDTFEVYRPENDI